MVNPVQTNFSDNSAVEFEDASSDETWKTVQVAASAADERKADNVVVLKVSEVCYLADYFVITTGFSGAQVRAICQAVLQNIVEELGRTPISVEGQKEGNWVLIDYGDVVIHIMLPDEREFYNLEAFWNHAEPVDWSAT
ncbi:MAG: ribosome silencing factor [Microcoleaceae cyanobacterium]